VHGRTETARRRRSSSNYVVSGNQDLTAPSPSARHLRLPCGNADSWQAHACGRGRVTYCGSAGEVLVPRHLAFLLPFSIYHSFMYFV
jgi:hypothetical protein